MLPEKDRTASNAHNSSLADYRQHLVLAQQKAQDDYDKTLVLLAGGALGLSFSKYVGAGAAHPSVWLLSAWICWGISLTIVLASFLLSHRALRRAIEQTDARTVHTERVGGRWSTALNIFNFSAGGFFVVGIFLMVVFVWKT